MGLWYKGANHAADIVLIAGEGEHSSIALIERKGEPFKGSYAFPGGFVDTNATPGEPFELDLETPLQAAIREAEEEISVDLSSEKGVSIQPIGVYDDPSRDPRNTKTDYVVSNAFLVKIPKEIPLKAQDDAASAQWISLKKVMQGEITLAFDHANILTDALDLLGVKYTPKDSDLAKKKDHPKMVKEIHTNLSPSM